MHGAILFRSAFGPKVENPFQTGVDPAAVESAAYVLRAIWIQHQQKNILVGWGEPTQPATTWLPSALEELEEIDREVLEDGLPTIKAKTRGEAVRILRELDGQTIQPTTYTTDDGEIVIHFQSPGVPAAVLIELSNDGQGACFSGLSGFPNAETLNLTMSYVDVGLIGHRVQTRKGPV